MKQLDGLRAMAVLAVLWTHYLPEEYWLFGIYWGGYGVRLFFVLSGFLITGILLKSRQYIISGKTMLIFCYAPVLHQKILANFSFILCNISLAVLISMPQVKEAIVWHVSYLSNVYFALQGRFYGSAGHLGL
jgi:peptidoglycan/LPS O-acetylase OafA/YrhL